MKIELVIFDCDGVLVDSEIVAHKIGAKEMTRVGFPLSVKKSIEFFSGVANENLANVIQEKYGKSIADNDVATIITKINTALLKKTRPIENIREVINYLELHGTPKCVASNSSFDYLTKILTKTKLHTYFKTEHIFNAAIVEKYKPMPDIFLYAARRLNINSTNCLVIEDSVVGIQAAKAAGMTVIGFLGGSHAKNSWYRARINQIKPHLIANDAQQLLDILKFAGNFQ